MTTNTAGEPVGPATNTTSAVDTGHDGPAMPASLSTLATDRPAQSESHPAERGAAPWPVVTALAAYAVLAVVGFWHAWTAGAASHAISPGGDQATSMWFLSWTAYAVVHGHNPLFSSFGNAPYGVNALVNVAPVPLYVLLTPVTLAWGPMAAYNLYGTLAFFASASAAFFLVRRFARWTPAAFLGGLLYGFSPYVVAQATGHANLEFVALPPLIMLCVLDIATGRAKRPAWRGVVLGVLVTLQFLISAEVLLSTAVVVGGGLVVLVWIGRHDLSTRARPALVGLGSGALVSVALLAYPLWAQFGGPAHVVGAVQTYPQYYRADLLGPVIPGNLMHFAPQSWLKISAPFAGNGSENGSYLGIPLLAVMAVGVVALRRRVHVVVAAILGAFAFLLSLGSHLTVDHHATSIPLPEGVFDKLPLLKNAIPVRYSVHVALFAGIVSACIVDELRRSAWFRTRQAVSAVVPLALGVGSLVPLLPTWPYPMVPAGVPAYFTSGAARDIPNGSVAMVYPFPDEFYAQPQLWQASTFLRFKMPGGRFIVPAPSTGTFTASRPSATDKALTTLFLGAPLARDPAMRSSIRRELRQWHVQYVIGVPTGQNPAAAMAYLSWLLGRAPRPVGGVDLWRLA